MGQARIVYQDWIVALGHDPDISWQEAAALRQPYNIEVIKAVNRALEQLDPEEAALIRLFYMQGVSYREISLMTGRDIYRLAAQNVAALKKLKALLSGFVKNRFTIKSPSGLKCPLCDHPRRPDIDRLLRSKTDAETWKRIYQVLRDDFDLRVFPARKLIGHLKYHAQKEE
jgi:hypothetical protein